MTTITLNQKRNSSFLSSLLFFIGITGLILTFFFLGKRHYQQSKNEEPNYKAEEEFFELLPEEVLPPEQPKEENELRKLEGWEINERISKQNQWKKNILPRLLEDKKIEERITEFLKHFYYNFLEKGLNKDEERWKREIKVIRPKKVDGHVTNEETLNSDIKKCKVIFPQTREARISFEGFSGWLTENEEGEEENSDKVTMGRCDTENKGAVTWLKSTDLWGNLKESVCYWTNRRITIKLKPELFFLRYNYNSWVTRDENTGGHNQLRIGWNQLTKTIAHELAHAVVNTILISSKSARLDKGGHGNLHDKFTKEIDKMIKKEHIFSTEFRDYIESF